MKLYHIQYDNQPYYVEAQDFQCAIETWRRHVAAEWGTDFEGTEEPESVALVHDGPVLRERGDVHLDAGATQPAAP